MSKLLTSVSVACLLLMAGFLLISCSGSGNPVAPNETGDSDFHDATGSDGINPQNNERGEDVPPGYPHPSDEPDYAPDEVLLTLKEGVIPNDTNGEFLPGAYAQAVDLLAQYGLGIKKAIQASWNTVYCLEILDGTSVPDKVAELLEAPEVDYAEPNYKVYFLDAPYFPNDPLWENPDDFDNDPRSTAFEQFGPSKIGASYVWDVARGDGTVVCVIDTGIQSWHEDLQDNMWINVDEIPDNDFDDDGNGYIDDIYGWDTDSDDNDITDYGGGSYHGTACAGVVAATQDNSVGCTGIAPGALLMGIRIGFNDGFYDAVIEGVEYAKNNGADIVTMSFITTYDSPLLKAAMDDAYDAGLLLAGGAGNTEGTPVYYPCSWSSVIKVGGTSPFSQKWAYNPIDEVRISTSAGFGWGSTYGNGQEVMAFGKHYITTHGGNDHKYWNGVNDLFFGGTSNATPMVAGALAVLKSYYPEEDAPWIRIRLSQTADDLHEAGYDSETGNGRINLIRAIYGSDRYADEEDENGFVDLAGHDNQIFDSLHYASGGDYIDTQDLYKITATVDGILAVALDIFTWGEDFDMQLYSDPSLNLDYLLDASVGENHGNDSTELVGVECLASETYYVIVYPAGVGDSSAYGLSAGIVENTLELETGSYDPGFVHEEGNDRLVGYMQFEAGYRVHLTEVIISQSGSMPPVVLAGIHLYRDTDGDRKFDGGDALVADGDFNGTNRAVIGGLYEEINMLNSPLRYFITMDISGVTEDAIYELALTSYKDITTEEGIEVDYAEFPRSFGPFDVGIDEDPPTWDDTVGIQSIEAKYANAILRWNSASDPLTPPVVYNVYWTQELPFDFDTADHSDDVNKSDGGDVYDYKWTLSGLNNGEEYFVAVRAEDQAGNEENNTEYLAVTPDPTSYPDAPQVIGSYNTPGNAWEVKADPVNQRVFVADSNGGVLVVDVSDPTNPTLADQVQASEVVGVDYDGTYVYAAGSSGLLIIDPDGPDGAELISLVDFSNALDVCVVGNWVYMTNFGTSILPVDVSDPYIPVEYSTVSSGQYGYGMDAQDGYLYVATNNKPMVFDLSDPSAPVDTGADFGGTYAYELDAIGDRLYVTYWFNHKFSIYSLADPANPSWIGQWKSNTGYNASDLVMFNGHLYFGTNYHHIEVLDVDDPSDITELGQISTNGPDGMDTDGTYVYSAENQHGLKILL